MVRDQIFKIIESVVAEINEELDYDSLRNVTEDTTLFGGDEGVDSLSLVFIVTNVERGIYEQLDRSVSLANEKAMSMRNSPYRNVGSLLEYALQCLEEA